MSTNTSETSKPLFAEWFCLAGDRKNFKTSPVPDRNFLLGEKEWEDEIDGVLKRATLLGAPVRLLWWGQYGIGKTHRLRHTEHVVASKGYNFRPVYATCSDITEKTSFAKLHYDMINSLGMESTRKLVSDYVLKLRNGAALPKLEDLAETSTDVAGALRTLGGDNQATVQYAWQFLCGLKLDGNDVRLAGVTKPALETSHDFASATSALGKIIEKETGKQLLFLIDEAENIQRITSKTMEPLWKECLRLLLDKDHINLILTVGAERLDGLPKIITSPDLVRRIQKDNIRQLDSFKMPQASAFIKQLLTAVIDPTAKANLEQSKHFPAPYDSALFPFADNEAFSLFCDHVTNDPRSSKPSEILEKLNRVTAEAYMKDRRLVDTAHLNEMGM